MTIQQVNHPNSTEKPVVLNEEQSYMFNLNLNPNPNPNLVDILGATLSKILDLKTPILIVGEHKEVTRFLMDTLYEVNPSLRHFDMGVFSNTDHLKTFLNRVTESPIILADEGYKSSEDLNLLGDHVMVLIKYEDSVQPNFSSQTPRPYEIAFIQMQTPQVRNIIDLVQLPSVPTQTSQTSQTNSTPPVRPHRLTKLKSKFR